MSSNNTEPPQHSCREKFNTERKFNPAPRDPQSKVANFLAHSYSTFYETYNVDSINVPIVDDDKLVSYSLLSPDELNKQTGNLFDGANAQKLAMAKASLPVKERMYDVLSERTENISRILVDEHPNAIRAVFTNETIAKKSIFSKFEIFYLIVSACIGGVSEWWYQASVMSSSALEPYIGSAGFNRALLSSFLTVLITIGLKVFLAQVPRSKMPLIWRNSAITLVFLCVAWVLVFVVNYQGMAEGGDPFNEPVVRMAVNALQMIVTPIVINMVWLYLKKSSENFLKQHITYDLESLGIDEEHESLSMRADDQNITVGYLIGYITQYEAKKACFSVDISMRVSMIQSEISGNASRALAEMYRSKIEKEPAKLKLVN